MYIPAHLSVQVPQKEVQQKRFSFSKGASHRHYSNLLVSNTFIEQDVFQSFFVQLKTMTLCRNNNRHRTCAQQF